LSGRQRSDCKPGRGTVARRKISRLRRECEIAHPDRRIVFAWSISQLPTFVAVTRQKHVEAQTSKQVTLWISGEWKPLCRITNFRKCVTIATAPAQPHATPLLHEGECIAVQVGTAAQCKWGRQLIVCETGSRDRSKSRFEVESSGTRSFPLPRCDPFVKSPPAPNFQTRPDGHSVALAYPSHFDPAYLGSVSFGTAEIFGTRASLDVFT